MERRRGAPRLYERARTERIRKGLSQTTVGRRLGKSQALISLIESGKTSIAEQREYLEFIEGCRGSHRRTSGGSQKVGRLRARRMTSAETVRGEPLDSSFDYAASLPDGGAWEILAVCRTAANAELAFLYDETQEIFGLVGFHLVEDVVRRGRIIPIEAGYDDRASVALEAFAQGALEPHSDEARLAVDDGLLADEEAV